MGKADGLCKRLDLKIGMENDNENQKLIKEEWIQEMIEVVVEGPEEVIKEKIKRAREKDEEVIKIVKEMKKAGVRNLREDKWEIKGDLILKEGKVYVLKDKELRIEIIQLHHDVLVAGHEERWKMMELVAGSNERCREICRRI